MRPEVETLNCGAKVSAAQLVTWKWLDSCARIPPVLDMVPATLSALQLVGLKTKSGRLISTTTFLTWKGMPYLPVGSAPFVTVSCAVCGFTLTVARTTSQSHSPVPRSSGPARSETSIEKPKGAPSSGPVRPCLASSDYARAAAALSAAVIPRSPRLSGGRGVPAVLHVPPWPSPSGSR